MDAETLPFRVNLGYQVPRNKAADYVGKQGLERVRALVEAGEPPFSHVLVGMRVGGKPIDEYAPDFWLVSDDSGADPVGYLTSPWWSPELKTNIAPGFVPVELSKPGTSLTVALPEPYAQVAGQLVDATVVEIPFRPSVNPNTRERLKERGG